MAAILTFLVGFNWKMNGKYTAGFVGYAVESDLTSSAWGYPTGGTSQRFPNSATASRQAYELISKPSVHSPDR